MHSILPYIVIGLTTGSVYGLVGTGLVLTYKTSNVFNFAYGSLAALSAFVFYFLRQQHNLPWPIAALISCVGLGIVLGLLLERVGREIYSSSMQIKVVTTVGLLLIVLALGTIWFPGTVRVVDPFLPTTGIKIAGVHVSWSEIITVLFALTSTIALYLFFRFTRVGVAMRAVVDNPELLGRTGGNPVRIRQYAWIIGALMVTASGLLLAPTINLDAETLTLLVVQAFAAAAIGGFTNLPLTFAGGIFLGILTALATKYSATYSSTFLSDSTASIPFLILFLVLIFTPPRRLAERYYKPVEEVRRSWQGPLPFRLVAGGLVLAFLLSVPSWAGLRLSSWSSFLVSVILLLALGLLVRMSGQISLSQVAFAAIGASTMGHLATSFHIPWLLALMMSMLVVVPVALLIAVPAIRLSGVFLALATLGFGIVVQQVFYPLRIMFGTYQYGAILHRPGGSIGPWHFSTDKGYYFVLLFFVVLVVLLIEAIAAGRLGRLLNAMGDSALVLETNGTTVAVTRVMVFCISAALAALSGVLGGSLFGFAQSVQFDPFSSLTTYVLVIIVFAGSPWYALLAAVGYSLGPAYIHLDNINAYLELLFGIGAVLYVFAARRPPTVPKVFRNFVERRWGSGPRESAEAEAARGEIPLPAPIAASAVAGEPAQGQGVGLVLSGVVVRFGGLTAVNRIDLDAPIGRITGLIGPNGAGKTTLFNACSGLLQISEGRISFEGRDITRMAPHQRAQVGIGRTFQRSELLNTLTVTENVEMVLEALYADGMPWKQVRSRRGERDHVHSAAQQAIRSAGLWGIRDVQVGLLPTGPRRRVEVARVLAGGYRLILLDEPSSGLDTRETRELGDLLGQAVRDMNVGILLVEHDISLVQQLCEYVHVLDFGNKIFEGTLDQMNHSEEVRAAYLGSDFTILQGTDTGNPAV